MPGSVREGAVRRRVSYTHFNPGDLFLIQGWEREALRCLVRHGVRDLCDAQVLDVGCGWGHRLREFVRWGADPANIVGVDPAADRIAEARRLGPSRMTLLPQSAERMDFPDGTFDLVSQVVAFSSMPDPDVRRRVAAEMLRLLKPAGVILWCDLCVRNPWNAAVHPLGRREIRELFPGCRFDLRRTRLARPIALALAPWSWVACRLLECLRLPCTHYVGIIRKA